MIQRETQKKMGRPKITDGSLKVGLTVRQLEYLESLSARRGQAPLASIVREAIDEKIEREEKET